MHNATISFRDGLDGHINFNCSKEIRNDSVQN